MALDPNVEPLSEIRFGDAADLMEARAIMVETLGLDEQEAADLTLSALTHRMFKRLQALETRIAWSCPTYGTEI